MAPLLFDHHLSPRLIARLADIFPGWAHVYPLGMDRASDREIWDYAGRHGYVLVTKDSDYSDLSTLLGFPPKVLWVRLGNCTTSQVESLLRMHHEAIEQFFQDPVIGLLVLA